MADLSQTVPQSNVPVESEKGELDAAGDVENLGDTPATPPTLPPEEGVTGWLCVTGAFFTLFATFGFLNAVGVFQSYYEQNSLSEYSSSDISWIFSFQLACMWAPGPIVGRLVDTYGPNPVLLPSAILCIFGLCMTSLSTEYYQIFLAQGVAFGIGAGVVFTTSFVCVGQWFVKRRGLAIGIASVGSSLGGVIYPVFLDRIIEEVGYAGCLRWTALFSGVLLAVGCLLITARLERRKWDWKGSFIDVGLFLEPKFALFTFGSFLVMWGLWLPFDFITTFAQSQGVDSRLAVAMISLINATSIPGRILPPYLSDTLGHFNVITISDFLIPLTILTLWLPFDFHPHLAGTIVFCLVYGFVSGTFVSLLMPCVAKTGSLETIGVRFGNFQLVLAVACLTGLPIAGGILARQENDTYWGLQTFAIVSTLLGAVLTAGSTYLCRRERGTWKM